MKNLLITFTLLLSINTFAQFSGLRLDEPRISFGLYQDGSLAVDNHKNGNSPFTADVRFEVMIEGEYNEIGSFLLGITTEYADLSEFNFVRYGLQSGYNFRNQRLVIGNLKSPEFDYAIYGGFGVIMRNFPEDNQNYMSLELTNELAYFFTEWFSVNLKGTLMQRGDLAEKYGDSSGSYRPWNWEFNGYVGLKFYLNRD